MAEPVDAPRFNADCSTCDHCRFLVGVFAFLVKRSAGILITCVDSVVRIGVTKLGLFLALFWFLDVAHLVSSFFAAGAAFADVPAGVVKSTSSPCSARSSRSPQSLA
jgi:hypothetical protein